MTAMEANLVSIRDVKLPTLGTDAPSVLVFRKWWKDLYRYCQRREEWRGAESLFRVVRGYPNELVPKERESFLTACTNRDNMEGGVAFSFDHWNYYDREK